MKEGRSSQYLRECTRAGGRRAGTAPPSGADASSSAGTPRKRPRRPGTACSIAARASRRRSARPLRVRIIGGVSAAIDCFGCGALGVGMLIFWVLLRQKCCTSYRDPRHQRLQRARDRFRRRAHQRRVTLAQLVRTTCTVALASGLLETFTSLRSDYFPQFRNV